MLYVLAGLRPAVAKIPGISGDPAVGVAGPIAAEAQPVPNLTGIRAADRGTRPFVGRCADLDVKNRLSDQAVAVCHGECHRVGRRPPVGVADHEAAGHLAVAEVPGVVDNAAIRITRPLSTEGQRLGHDAAARATDPRLWRLVTTPDAHRCLAGTPAAILVAYVHPGRVGAGVLVDMCDDRSLGRRTVTQVPVVLETCLVIRARIATRSRESDWLSGDACIGTAGIHSRCYVLDVDRGRLEIGRSLVVGHP